MFTHLSHNLLSNPWDIIISRIDCITYHYSHGFTFNNDHTFLMFILSTITALLIIACSSRKLKTLFEFTRRACNFISRRYFMQSHSTNYNPLTVKSNSRDSSRRS